ncbi:MAG: hypothetical protein AB1757_10560 [Acidobacteriota bacterium]
MQKILNSREQQLRDYFGIAKTVNLLSPNAIIPEETDKITEHLRRFNIEWHVIPSEEAVPFDADYIARMYPMCGKDFTRATSHQSSCQQALNIGHHRHQGLILGVESTQKPNYLPHGRHFYGSEYGHDWTLDPIAGFIGEAGFTNGTRFAHDYASLRSLMRLINEDWRSHALMPMGYRVTICPPAVFNLIGNVFHREWSHTQSLELGAYRDEFGNANAFAVGCNAANDFSYVHHVETNSDWTYLGFRLVLVPDWL